MSTFLFSEFVFGPIKSRRLGSSLGVNLLSLKQKVCNYNCIYCECGLTSPLTKEKSVFVDQGKLITLLEKKLKECLRDDIPIDVITFAGNGEPTLHPNFLAIVNRVIELRDKYFPSVEIVVLTNGFTLHKKRVIEALEKVDKAVIKLDAGDDTLLQLIDQPKGKLNMGTLIDRISNFKGKLIIQTMFLKGKVDKVEFDNSKGEYLKNWIRVIKRLKPREVMLYSLDRDTPLDTLKSISRKELNKIAEKLTGLNIKTQVV